MQNFEPKPEPKHEPEPEPKIAFLLALYAREYIMFNHILYKVAKHENRKFFEKKIP